jgi:hypothetical protein
VTHCDTTQHLSFPTTTAITRRQPNDNQTRSPDDDNRQGRQIWWMTRWTTMEWMTRWTTTAELEATRTAAAQHQQQGLETRRALDTCKSYTFSSLSYLTNYFLQAIYVTTTKKQSNKYRLNYSGSGRVEFRKYVSLICFLLYFTILTTFYRLSM